MDYKYIDKIFERANVQQISEFLLYGVELREYDNRTYGERLKQDSANILKRIEHISRDEQEIDEIFSEYSDAEYIHKKVFFELGMKAGARLLFELLYQDGAKYE